MSGAFMRRVLLEAHEGHVDASLEDDFHHFTLQLAHDGKAATGVRSEAVRHPWTTCPQAGARLQELVGCALAARPQQGTAAIDAHQQCTHQYDLALMALAQGARGGRRAYLARVDDELDGRRLATLVRDGALCLRWTLEGSTIVAGGELQGANLRKLDLGAIGDADLAEAVMLLRRSVMVAGGRGIDFDVYPSLEVFAGRMTGACFAFQPQRLAEGKRHKGSVRDFSN
ncbi:MAG: hypothetical protein V4857_09635 [Pseudomonadota bacterium]